jgi:hypothetical protein
VPPRLLLAATVALSICALAQATAESVVLGVDPQPRLAGAPDAQVVAEWLGRVTGAARRVGHALAGARPSAWRQHLPTASPAALLPTPQSFTAPPAYRFVGLSRPDSAAPPIPLGRPHLTDLPPPAASVNRLIG